VDAWLVAAEISAGPVFRAINKESMQKCGVPVS
jgi:hypothetical protein